jgi:hypothetical protein
MANTFTLIESKILSSATSSITFSAIPQTYNNLKFVISARANTSGGYTNIMIGFNGSISNITWIGLYGYGGGGIGSNTNGSSRIASNANANSTTENVFSNNEIYIPNYTSSYPKTISSDGVIESNDTSNNILGFDTDIWNPATQAAVTSITFTCSAVPTADFIAGSSFYLYGIKNS